jgi:hypothetical protein
MIPWAMWKNRNNIEHLHDIQTETARVDSEVQEELSRGHTNNDDIQHKLTEHWLSEPASKSGL